MAFTITMSPLLHLTLFLLLVQLAHPVLVPERKDHTEVIKPPLSTTYIVHADPMAKPNHFATHGHWYTSMVATATPATKTNSGRVFYVYDTVMHGFAAELTDDQARRLASTPGVAGLYRDRVVPLHTTRSPGFLGLDTDFGVWPETDFGDGIIIGFIDTGIWPESASFNDSGLGPVRNSWKGRCAYGERFNASMCNNKLVGARSFLGSTGTRKRALQSPRDGDGHGTHVASTAAGSEVLDANLFSFARGTARGVAPKARVAMYKACAPRNCRLAGIVAAIDAAVKDGVDILSVSLGHLYHSFYDDLMSVALFGAVRAGVFVTCSAGNGGPTESSVINDAPWITTVGAASVDRVFPVTVTLGDGQVLTGQSLYAEKANKTDMVGLSLPSSCDDGDLVPDRIMGKIVVCSGFYASDGFAVQRAGASGLISLAWFDWRMDGIDVQAFNLPAVSLGNVDSRRLEEYILSVPYPVASFRFTCRTVTGENRAPKVDSFSSRGPSRIAREILKPDVMAPGISILAAWPDELPLTDTLADPRRSSFNMISGTSMACPHVAGVAALLRHKHRDWTPAMIRSAIMTTATMLDNHGRAITDNAGPIRGASSATPFSAGAGLVRPQLALDPGLVYDATEQEYVAFLCTLNYTTAQIRLFVPGFASCARTLPGGIGGLNYPSFVVAFGNGPNVVRVLERTVTKVSEGPETYTVRVEAPELLVAVTVMPGTLEFGSKNQKKSYKVVFTSKSSSAAAGARGFGNIVWENDVHQVRSPVVFMWG